MIKKPVQMGAVCIIIAIVLLLSGCAKQDGFIRKVSKKYTDSGINFIELKTDGSFYAITDGREMYGTWDTDGRSCTVREGQIEYDGVPLLLTVTGDSDGKNKIDAVVYTDGEGVRKMQFGGSIYSAE